MPTSTDAEQALSLRMENLEKDINNLKKGSTGTGIEDRVCIVCFSGEWDKLFAAFTMANGALALGMDVHLFFTFWGACALREGNRKKVKRGFRERLMNLFLPRSVEEMPLSRMNYGGLGKRAMKSVMKRKGIENLSSLIEQSKELGAVFHCCDTSMDLLEIRNEDLKYANENDWCGVASFLSLALKSRITMFV
jgi:peroxiredoxin family protein